MSRYRCFTIDFTDLVRPDPHCVHYASQLEVFRWMVRTGDSYRDAVGGYDSNLPYGMREALSDTSGVNLSCVYPLAGTWRDRLHRIFARVILGSHNDAVARWRKDYGVAVYRRKTIYAPTTAAMLGRGDRWAGWGADSWDCCRRLDRILQIGGKLKVSPNEFHRRATRLHGCLLNTAASGLWRVVARYGYADGSGLWFLTVTEGKRGEALPRFLKRTETELAGLMRPPTEAKKP